MSVTYTRTYTPLCSGDLFTAINNAIFGGSPVGPLLEQIIYDGVSSTDFVFAEALDAGEEAELDSILSTFICPVYSDPVDNQTVDDNTIATDNLWSSSKISSELSGKANTVHTHTTGDLTDVVLTTPADNDILAYDTGTSKWINQTAAQAGVATTGQLSSHTGDSSIHFTEASINHHNITNVGTNTHTQLDAFKAKILEQDLDTLSSGIILGGEISQTFTGSPPTPTNEIQVAAGTGYINNGTEYKKISWNATSVFTVADGTNYICVDENGIAYASTSSISPTRICLGHVYVAGSNTMVLETFAAPRHVDNFGGRVQDYVAKLRTRISGNSVHEKLSPNFLELDIDEGTFYTRLNTYDVPATSTFTKLYNTSVGWMVDYTNPNKVNTTHWNDVTANPMGSPPGSPLVAMTTGWWKKDVIVRVPNGNVYYVYGQDEYLTFEQAQNAQVPTIPDEIKLDAAYLAYIIVQEGSTSISEFIRDITPSLDRIFGYGTELHGSDIHNNGYALIDHEHHVGGYTNSSTGLLVGGAVSINGGDNTKVDIAAGTAFFVDNTTDTLKPTVKLVSWGDQTAVTINNIGTTYVTYFGVDITGAIVQSSTPYKFETTRDIVPIGAAAHPSGFVGFILDQSLAAYDPALRLADLANAVGIINISGNQYSPNGTNLKIDKTSGKSYALGINFDTDKRVPDISQDPASTPVNFVTIHRDGSGGYVFTPTSDIDTDNYDSGTGSPSTLTPIPTGEWVSIPVFYVPGLGTSGTRVQYPQRTFATQAEALANTPDLEFETAAPLINHATVRTYIVVQQGATNLSDASVVFVQGGKFSGTVAGGGGGGGGAPTDASYLVTTSDPTLTNEKVIGTDFFVNNTHVATNAGIVESKLSLNFPTHSNANDPSATQKEALAGTSGTPSNTNRYVTDSDTRLSNSVSHIANTSNPHSTSLVNLTDTTITTPSPGQVLTYNGSVWINDEPSVGSQAYGELYYNGLLGPLSYTINVPRKFVDFTVGTESGGTTVVGSAVNDRITIGADGAGTYYVSAYTAVEDVTSIQEFTITIYKNGNPTTIRGTIVTDGAIELARSQVHATGVISLLENDYLEVYVTATSASSTAIYHGDTRLAISRTGGQKGDQGLPGSGSTISLRDENTPVANTPHTTINFAGNGVSVADSGSGVATVTINQPAAWVINQQVFGTITAQTGTTTIPLDNTTPLSTEGTLMGQVTLTPTAATARIEIHFSCNVSTSQRGATAIVAVFRGTTCIGSALVVPSTGGLLGADGADRISMTIVDAPNTTSPVTYSGRIGVTSGTWRLNSAPGGQTLGGSIQNGSQFIITEFEEVT